MRSCSCLKSLPFWLKFNPRLFDWIKDIGVMSTILSLSLSKKNLICAVVVVKWSVRSPSTPTIRVRILQFFCTILFEKNENKKRPGLAHFYFLKKKNLIQNRTQNFYHTCWAISISNLLFLSSFFVLVFLSTSDSHFKMVFVDLTPPPFVKGGFTISFYLIPKGEWVAAIAPWFHLGLPSCGPRFESQAHHQCFFQFVLLKL